jgi:hypothetical protein
MVVVVAEVMANAVDVQRDGGDREKHDGCDETVTDEVCFFLECNPM